MEDKRRYNYAFYEIFSSEFKKCQVLSAKNVARMYMDFVELPTIKQEQLEETFDGIVTKDIMPVLRNNGITDDMECQMHAIVREGSIMQRYLFPGGKEVAFDIKEAGKGKYRVIYRIGNKKFKTA